MNTGKLFLLLLAGVANWDVYAQADPQAQTGTDWQAPKTAFGHPDLQGIWYFGTSTPMVRPEELGEQLTYTEEEAARKLAELHEAEAERDRPLDPNRPPPEAGAPIGLEAEDDYMSRNVELTRINGEYRTSLIIDPPNGRMPVNPDYEDHFAQLYAEGAGRYDGPETLGASERCLIYALAVPSMYPMPWNAHLQIVQNDQYVMIMTEMIHDARIIRLNAEHHPQGFRTWMGDSVGYWEDGTLVVHTINFRNEQSSAGMLPMSDEFELTEWFTPVSENEIVYRFTIKDPKAYTQPFTVERTIRRVDPDVKIYEFACHEGNYSMGYSLTGARVDEFNAAAEVAVIRHTHLAPEVIAQLAGVWAGEVNGANLQFAFTPGETEGMAAVLDIPNRGAGNMVIDEIQVSQGELVFTVPEIGARFEGQLEGDAIVGQWSRLDYSMPLQLDRK